MVNYFELKMNLWFIFLHIAPIFLIIYFYVKRKYSYWSNLGVKGPAPSLLSFGNVFQFAGHLNPPENEVSLVQTYGPVYGNYTGLRPTLTVADVDVIKQIMVKDFHLFINRRQLNTFHEMFNHSLFFGENDDWKRVRAITSPAFSTGKLRLMQPIVLSCVDKLVFYLDKLVTYGDGVMITKKVMAGFSIDAITSTAFATETNANDERIKENPLVTNALALSRASAFQILSFASMPRWFNDLVGVHHPANQKSVDYIQCAVTEILKSAKEERENENDLVQLLIDSFVYESELKNGGYSKLAADVDRNDISTESQQTENLGKSSKSMLSDNEIIAQCMLFFGAGFDTTSNAITHLIFELSHHSEIQERLISYLHEHLDHLDAASDEYYEKVMSGLPYLDAVIKETLRKYPALARLERRVSVDGYKISGITLKENQLVEVPTFAVHYNPDYFPSPEQFNPDRFMPENKHLLQPYTYIPFGVGPRNCIGMRFAYQEIKMCIAKVMRQFRFSTTPQTPSKLQFETFKFGIGTKPFETMVTKQ